MALRWLELELELGSGVGVVVGWVGVDGVTVVGWRVVNELRNEELLVGGVLSEAVKLLCEVFCEL